MTLNIVFRVCVTFVASFAFAALFNTPRKELPFCGLTAAAGWLFYELVLLYFPDATVSASFAGAIAISVCGRILSYTRKYPVTIYLVTGIIPLVPGAYIYYTMYESVITGDILAALSNGIMTFKIAGVIAAGIIFVLSLPKSFFDFREGAK